jgi:hypothetical protein
LVNGSGGSGRTAVVGTAMVWGVRKSGNTSEERESEEEQEENVDDASEHVEGRKRAYREE